MAENRPASRWLRAFSLRSRGYRRVSDALDRLTELVGQRGRDPAGSKQLRRQIRVEVTAIREYAAEHPDAITRIHADVHSRGLADSFPWRKLNRGTARDLAVLYCFTPYLDTSALVAARRLQARGVVTDVISQQIEDTARADPSSERIAREYLDQTREFSGVADFGSWTAARTFAEKVVVEVDELERTKGPYRTLYTRAFASQSHFAGVVLKHRRPDLVWTAEFSDPLRINPFGEVRNREVDDDWLFAELKDAVGAAGFAVPDTRLMFTWAELIAYALADEIVFTNEHQRRYMLDRCPYPEFAARAASVAAVRHHPTLPASFYQVTPSIYPLEPGLLNIGYFGNFYATRGLDEIVEALEQLTPPERELVRLHVFTSDPRQLLAAMRARGADDVVIARQYVPYLKFLNLTTRFDALLVNDFTTADRHFINPYLPAKVSDYLGSGTPLWAVQEPGSVLSGLGSRYVSDLGDAAGALAVLREMLADKVE